MTAEETQRLFVALTVPSAVAGTLAALPHRGLDADWLPAADFHLTLRSLGDVPAAQLPVIDSRLAAIARDAFTVEIDGIDSFAERRPGILYAKIASRRKTTALCAAITDTLTPLGFDFGTRPFEPHIALARLPLLASSSLPQVAAYCRRHGPALKAHWQAASFSLIKSADPAAGQNTFNILQSYPLR